MPDIEELEDEIAELEAEKAAISKVQALTRGKQARASTNSMKEEKARISKANVTDLLRITHIAMDTVPK